MCIIFQKLLLLLLLLLLLNTLNVNNKCFIATGAYSQKKLETSVAVPPAPVALRVFP